MVATPKPANGSSAAESAGRIPSAIKPELLIAAVTRYWGCGRDGGKGKEVIRV